ncbi:hypothetical protein DYU11_04325 [Fibrisoma montanum]|uniref:Uncharacterized protein n=2 Tax=Fibrisoma montanum TaxID=2305895 RepID=A0A418MJG6_9BACT|nr:hypothetical protein DYU11_04325 [Fibrisoma montanum]
MNTQPELIPGIYNFCDSWCQRCLFTSRCRSFQLQAAQPSNDSVTREESLIQQLTEALNLTKQYVEKMRQSGVQSGNASSPEVLEQEALQKRTDASSELASKHPVAGLADQYMRLSGDWFKDEVNLLEQAGRQQIEQVQLGFHTQEEALVKLNRLKDAWEMIRWYRTLIPVKTVSALRAATDTTMDQPLLTYHLGKAKLVLVSIDRSLLAWQTILTHYPEKTDDLLDMLALLSRLRREMEATLPEARAFQRPGLD